MENRSLQRILRKRKDNLTAQQKYKFSQIRCEIRYYEQPVYKSRHKRGRRNYYPLSSEKKAKVPRGRVEFYFRLGTRGQLCG